MKDTGKRFGILVCCLLMVSPFCAPAQAAMSGRQLYISMAGSNANPGTKTRPFRTLQYAADMAKPGDTIDVRGGTYCQRLAVTHSGSATDGYITIRSAPGETAILDGGCLFP